MSNFCIENKVLAPSKIRISVHNFNSIKDISAKNRLTLLSVKYPDVMRSLKKMHFNSFSVQSADSEL